MVTKTFVAEYPSGGGSLAGFGQISFRVKRRVRRRPSPLSVDPNRATLSPNQSGLLQRGSLRPCWSACRGVRLARNLIVAPSAVR